MDENDEVIARLTPEEQAAVFQLLENGDLRREVDRLSAQVIAMVYQAAAEPRFVTLLRSDGGLLPAHAELLLPLLLGWICGFAASAAHTEPEASDLVSRQLVVAAVAAGYSGPNAFDAGRALGLKRGKKGVH